MESQKELFTPQLNTTYAQRLKIVRLMIENRGFNYFPNYGLDVEYDRKIYRAVADDLEAKRREAKNADMVCHEDVLMAMIAGGHALTITDQEAGGKFIGCLSSHTIMKNWEAISPDYLLEIYNEEDDANTADCILQTLCFGSVIYG